MKNRNSNKTLFEVATFQGTTLEIGTNRNEVFDSFKRSSSAVLYRYTGDSKSAICRKVDGAIVAGSTQALFTD